MYALLRPLLFCLAPESAHALSMKALKYLPSVCFKSPIGQAITVMGLEFSHPVGLAAGFDKNAEYLDVMQKLGFAFVEVGTVTPKPQSGNPKPRLFRLPAAGALINRMGFNNLGVDVMVANLQKSRFQGVVGVNVGKNKHTSLNHAVDDYRYCLQLVYQHASYVALNVSSPNTPDLRLLQSHDYFKDLISAIRDEQQRLADKHKRHVPLVVKLSPDENDDALKRMAESVLSVGLDGIIATNTTLSREVVADLPFADQAGGLSGKPLLTRSTQVLRLLKAVVGDEVALIGVGGIDDAESARQTLASGASLIQLYTGLIYQGPGLISTLTKSTA